MRRATDTFAVLIALAGFAVSYATQADLAAHHGFSAWEAWLWPGIADAAALGMVVRLHFGQVRPGWPTLEAWGVFSIASAVAVAANAVADRADPLGGVMHGVVPVVVLMVAHVIVHGRPTAPADTSPVIRADVAPDAPAVVGAHARPAIEAGAQRPPSGHAEATAPDATLAVRRTAERTSDNRAKAARAVKRAVTAGREPTTADVQRATGVGERQARRLLSEVVPGRRPRVLELEAAPAAAGEMEA